MTTYRMVLFLGLWKAAIVCHSGAATSHETTICDFFTNKVFMCPEAEQAFDRDGLKSDVPFKDAADGGFVSVAGLDDMRVTAAGTVSFTVSAGKAVLGWGQVAAVRTSTPAPALWNTQFEVRLEARQSAASTSRWSMAVCVGGDPEQLKNVVHSKAELAGQGWQTMKFIRVGSYYRGALQSADGLIFNIEAEPATEVEIRTIKIVRRINEGFFRDEFDVPTGKIWRAIATVGNMAALYVNGNEVPDDHLLAPRPFHSKAWMYQTRAVDIKPYLRSGKNCLGLSGYRLGGNPPYIFLQGSVVMESGEIIRIGSDENWRWSPAPVQNWNKTGFDAHSWKTLNGNKNNARTASVAESGLSFKNKWDRPEYDGLLLLQNPSEPRLFYSDSEPARFNILAPRGLAGSNPAIRWEVCRVVEDAVSPVNSGETAEFETIGNSIMFPVEIGTLPRGVYTVCVKMTAGDELIESRLPEPFVVAGKIPMRPTAGAAMEDGMDLTLETRIDFTDLTDPRPVLETDGAITVDTPIIVKRNGLKYRETRPIGQTRNCTPTAAFSCNIQFKRPGDFYLMALEYPDDRERWMGVACTPEYDGEGSYAKAGPAVFTGGKHPVSGKMREMKWIYRADPGWCAVTVMTLQNSSPAAAAGLKVFHIGRHLPELMIADAGERRLGAVMETLSFRYPFLLRRQPVEKFHERFAATGAQSVTQPIMEACRYLDTMLDTCEAYTEYLRFSGQNLAVVGCYQYEDTSPNSLYSLNTSGYDLTGAVRIPMDYRDMAVRVFDRNGIDMLANVEFMCNSTLVGRHDSAPEYLRSDRQVAEGADTIRLVTKDGKQTSRLNFLHPKVEAAMLDVAGDIAAAFKDQPNFLGLHWMGYFGGNWLPSYRVTDRSPEYADPFVVSYDDATIARFEKDTEINIPLKESGAARFQQRHAFLTSPEVKGKWIQWRCEQMRAFFKNVLAQLREQRSDLQCAVALYFYPPHVREWLSGGKPLRQFMRDWGWDPELFKDDDNLWFVQLLQPTAKYEPAYRTPGYAAAWEQNAGADFYNLYARTDNRAVMLLHAWMEVERTAQSLPERTHWARPFQTTMMAHAAGDFAREAFTQAMIGADPEMVLFGFCDAGLIVGGEQPLREFAQVLRALPREKFQPVDGTGFDSNLAIRDLRQDGVYYVCAMNPGYWPARGHMQLTGARQIVALSNGKPAIPDEAGRLHFDLPPYGMAAWRMAGDAPQVAGWGIEPVPGTELAHIRGLVGRVRKYLDDPKIVSFLADADAAFMRDETAAITAALQNAKYVRAWQRVANWRYWSLLHDGMEKAAQLPVNARQIDPGKLPRLNVKRADPAPVPDGKLNDRAWRKADAGGDFSTSDRWIASPATFLRLAYDATNLYAAVECLDPLPGAIRETAGGASELEVWSSGDDAVALFIQPDPAQPCYYQMAFTAGGVKFDQKVEHGAKDYDFEPHWQVAVGKTDKSWVAEITIPLASLNAAVAPNRPWRINCFRRFRNDSKPPSYWSWADGNAHDTNRFGGARFLP